MKFPLSLLKRFLLTDASVDTISATLTAIGLEVDGVEDKSAELSPFVVAEILSAERHPQAEKLQVCQVNTVQGVIQIVCGAPNARAGIKVVLANIGTVIPTNGLVIKKSAIRGVESCGMMCSARELGLGEDHAGIIELPTDAPLGASIVDVMGLNDPIFDVAITANRGDCMGVYGIARDLAAAGLGELKPLCVPTIAEQGETLPIRTETEACPVFFGRVIRGVTNGPAPQWMQDVLTKAGMRPISTLVDITNYFTLAFGRPLHVYDLAKLTSGIVVRNAHEGEELLALNEKTYRLTSQMCVVADEAKALCIGGIMGGAESGVTEFTTDILLELALFDAVAIAQTGRALQIDSDARSRFERGVDTGFMELAELRATEMILELCGGRAAPRVVAGEIPKRKIEIPFDAGFINRLGGTEIAESTMRELLVKLGFRDHGDHMHPPTWRHDVSQPADLAEEVLRLVGYDAIPSVSLPKHAGITRPALSSAQARLSTLRRSLAARGLNEHYGWGFCSEKQAALFGGQSEALHLQNPISADLSVMRPSLLPHLLEAAANNLARDQKNLGLFEVGATFQNPTPTGQKTVATTLRTGLRAGAFHYSSAAMVEWSDAKADALATLEALGMDASKVQITRNAPAWYHPTRSGAIMLGPKLTLGYFGQLHPSLLAECGCEGVIVASEIFVDAIPAAKLQKPKAIQTSDYQPVTRDFAFVVDATLPVSELFIAINKAEKNLLQSMQLFDVYQGKGVEEGKKSIAFSITLQAMDRTLSDAEIDGVAQAIIASVSKAGGILR